VTDEGVKANLGTRIQQRVTATRFPNADEAARGQHHVLPHIGPGSDLYPLVEDRRADNHCSRFDHTAGGNGDAISQEVDPGREVDLDHPLPS